MYGGAWYRNSWWNRRPAGIGGGAGQVHTPGFSQLMFLPAFPVGAAARMWSAVAQKVLQRNAVNIFPTWVDFGEIIRIHNESDYSGTVSSHFEAILRTTDVTVAARARLFNITDNVVVSGSQVATVSTTTVRRRSPPMAIPVGEKLYKAQLGV